MVLVFSLLKFKKKNISLYHTVKYYENEKITWFVADFSTYRNLSMYYDE